MDTSLKQPTHQPLPAPALLFILAGAVGFGLPGTLAGEQPREAAFLHPVRALEEAFAKVYDEVAPSVVVIQVHKQRGSGRSGASPYDGQFFDFFFDGPPRNQPENDENLPAPRFEPGPPSESEGSGFIAREDGFIYTNYHVIENAESIEVRLKDGRKFEGVVVGVDEKTDIAVLKIDASDLPAVRLADSDQVRVGQMVCAIGAPYNLDFSFTGGWVSAVGRSNLNAAAYESYIQTDASINPGNSGGPLCDLEGRVVGMNTLINGINRGLGFAIPSNMIEKIGRELIAKGRVVRPWIGVRIATLGEDRQSRMLMGEVDKGVVVQTMFPDTPAYSSDLRPADIITAVDGVGVGSAEDLQREILRKEVGEEVTLTVWRQGRYLDVNLVTGEQPTTSGTAWRQDRTPPEPGEEEEWSPGFHVQSVTPELVRHMDLQTTHGWLVTEVDRQSPAERAGLRRGDVITGVGNEEIGPEEESFWGAFERSGVDSVLLFYNRDGDKAFAVVERGS